MIPLSHINLHNKSWQQQLARAITDPQELCRLLELPAEFMINSEKHLAGFSLKVTRDFIDCMRKGDVNDPLLRQVLPAKAETQLTEGYLADPVGDLDAAATPGLIHKYHGRVLLISTPACAIHCRYCFRRHFPYSTTSANGSQLEEALAYIQNNTEINEVILSGGDPLSLSDPQLESLVSKIELSGHVDTLRIHSRLPVVLPDRLTDKLLDILKNSRLQSVLVIHCNHPNELSDKVLQSLRQCVSAGITLLNQSVLLAGVNDDETTLITLSRKLFSAGVLPYYLHMLDPVAGAAHFAVADARALELHQQMKIHLPGFLVPRLVREIARYAFKKDLR